MTEQIGPDISTTLSQIDKKLAQISSVLACQLIGSEIYKDKTQGELVDFLNRLGFDREQMSGILNTTIGSINSRMAELKKEGKA